MRTQTLFYENPEEDYMEYRHFMWIEKEGLDQFAFFV